MDKIPYIIIGMRKCGTTSLEKWMKKNGYDIRREEQLITEGDIGSYDYIDGRRFYKGCFIHRRPIIILRDPIKRIFSNYHYKQNHQQGDKFEIFEKTLEEAIDNHPELLDSSNYDKYLKKWESYNILKLYFEDVIKWKDFPHETQCDCKIKMTEKDEKLIRSKITYKLHSKYLGESIV